MNQYDSGCCFRGATKPKEVRILWELNTSCNLSCSWCHAKDNKHNGMSSEFILEGLEIIKKWGIKGIIFSGGEPLLRKDIFQVIEKAYNLGLTVDLCTNGTLVNNNVAKMLKKYLSEVSISLDSADPEKHDNIRGTKGAFYSTIEGIKNLVNENIEVHAISMCCNDNYLEIEDTVKLLANLGVHSVTLLGLIEIEKNNSPYKFSKDSKNEIINVIDEVRKKYPNIIINTKRIKQFENAKFCGAGVSMIAINSLGFVCPCILLENKVNKISLENLKNISNISEVLEKLNEQNVAYYSLCKNI